jgi:hypothetical protein
MGLPLKMNRGTIIAGVGLAAFGLIILSEEKPVQYDSTPTGIPTSKRLSYRVLQPGDVDSGNARLGPAILLLDGKPVNVNSGEEAHRALARELHNGWTIRQAALPKDADRAHVDAYSKELYSVPAWLYFYTPSSITKAQYTSAINGLPVDEYGRSKPGEYGSADNSLWGQTLGGLLKNPLFKAVVVAALVASGPEGAAIYGAYAMWQNRGQEFTVKNVVLGAARAYAVSQCGELCGKAFDFGVGAASGKSIDKNAEDILLDSFTPAERDTYNQAKSMAKGAV